MVCAGFMVFAAGAVQHTSVLAGKVSTIAAVGTSVKEGDVLVSVSTLAGSIPATRATVDGVVKEVLVEPGSAVTQGQVVVVVDSK